MIRIEDIDHIVIRARDAAMLERFYCEVLGCTVELRQAEIGLVQLRAGRAMIDIVDVAGALGRKGGAAPGREGRNLDHVCVRVEPFDVDAIRAHLARQGVAIDDEGERYGAEGLGFSLYVSDPEGNTIELKGPARRSWQEIRRD